SAPAANEPGHDVRATVFEHPWVEVGAPLAEIEHVEWVHPADATAELAPLLRDVVLPALGARPRLGTVAVFTGSASGSDPGSAQAAGAFVRTAAAGGVSIVYGGGKVGLMGVVANAALAAGGAVHGVIPQALVDGESAHAELTQLAVVPDMHARKNRMAEVARGRGIGRPGWRSRKGRGAVRGLDLAAAGAAGEARRAVRRRRLLAVAAGDARPDGGHRLPLAAVPRLAHRRRRPGRSPRAD